MSPSTVLATTFLGTPIRRAASGILTLGVLWLFLLALPALADGGPHVASVNSGTGTYGSGTGLSNGILTSDNCAACHRAHTAQATDITISAAPALCLTCHSGAGTGATTDVENGIQYAAASGGTRGGAVLGALRSGGFVNARIDSTSPSRVRFGSGDHDFKGKVPVLSTGAAVTSRHMNTTAVALATVWGSGPLGVATSVGDQMSLNCTSCHNPHGNNQYRILNPIPTSDETPPGTTWTPPTTPRLVTDALPTIANLGTNTRNYTVLQNSPNTWLTVAAVQAAGLTATQGDYWRRMVPWTSNTGQDNPTGQTPVTQFQVQISNWCEQCHTRYMGLGGAATTDSGDPIYRYVHTTNNKPECTQCHVAHGSNAQMPGTNSAAQLFPGQATGSTPYTTVPGQADSRLLKIANRGTCQMCHDPTRTTNTGDYSGPLPSPGVP